MKHIEYYAIAALMLLLALPMRGQNVTSPYSMYGYGLLNDNATSKQRQMGGVGIAMQSGRQINAMNPASYACIDSLTFLFDMGADLSLLWNKDGDAREHSTGGGLDYVTMQFPISKYFGGSIGLMPYTSVGYSFGSDIAHGTRENQGTGGINQAYAGFSGRYAGVSLGFNISYNFGNIVNDVYTNPEVAGRTLFEHVMEVRDWNINIGAQYSLNFDKFNNVALGVTYSPRKTLLGKTWVTVQDLTQADPEHSDRLLPPDTAVYTTMKNKYYQPDSWGFGLAYTHQRTSRLNVEADFIYQTWSKAKFSSLYDAKGQVAFQGMNFNDRYRLALGAEFVPKIRGNFAQRIAIRAGGYFSRDYLKVLGNNIREYGVSAGVGLPTIEGKTLINIGFEWKHRMSSPATLITENYFNITLGVNFNELWFWQRKIK